MRQLRVSLLFVACALCIAECRPLVVAQASPGRVDWRAELKKAKAGIKKNPDSAFWHNQAGVAYDALGDFDRAVKELKVASALDLTNPVSDYALFALYKKKDMIPEERQILLKALEKDSANPLGHFEFAGVLENERHLQDALKEYREARRLVAMVKGSEYIDPRGNPYDVRGVREKVNNAIERVAKQAASTQNSK